MGLVRSCCFGLTGCLQFATAIAVLVVGSAVYSDRGDCVLSPHQDTKLCESIGWAAWATILSSLLIAVSQGCLYLFCGSGIAIEVAARFALTAAWGVLSVVTIVFGLKADDAGLPHQGARHATAYLCIALFLMSLSMVATALSEACLGCCRCCRARGGMVGDCGACLEGAALASCLFWWCAPRQPPPPPHHPRQYGGVHYDPLPCAHPHQHLAHHHQPSGQQLPHQHAAHYAPAPQLTPHSGPQHPYPHEAAQGAWVAPGFPSQMWAAPAVQSHQCHTWPLGVPAAPAAGHAAGHVYPEVPAYTPPAATAPPMGKGYGAEDSHPSAPPS